MTIHWLCQGSAVGGTLQLAGDVLSPPLWSQGPYSPFEAEREAKAALSFPSPPAVPALVGTCTHGWEDARRKGASGWRMGRQWGGGTASPEPETTHGAPAFAATLVIWQGWWTVPPCPAPKAALGTSLRALPSSPLVFAKCFAGFACEGINENKIYYCHCN